MSVETPRSVTVIGGNEPVAGSATTNERVVCGATEMLESDNVVLMFSNEVTAGRGCCDAAYDALEMRAVTEVSFTIVPTSPCSLMPKSLRSSARASVPAWRMTTPGSDSSARMRIGYGLGASANDATSTVAKCIGEVAIPASFCPASAPASMIPASDRPALFAASVTPASVTRPSSGTTSAAGEENELLSAFAAEICCQRCSWLGNILAHASDQRLDDVS